MSNFELIWSGTEVIKRFRGEITLDDFVRASLQVQRDPRFDQLRSVVNDLTECTISRPPEPAKMEEVAARDAAAALSNPNICVAMVVTHQNVEQAVDAYLDSKLSPFKIRTFGTLEAARRWAASNPAPALIRHARIR